MANENIQVAAERAAGAAPPGPATERGGRRIVFLNAMPLNSLPRRHLALDVMPININDLVAWIQRRLQEGWQVIHFIRHPATIQALRAVGIPLPSEPNSGLYSYQPGDIVVVVSLRNPVRGQEQNQVTPQDLESWVVTVL